VLDHPELDMPGWRTLHGGADRNGVAPPVTELGEMIDLDGPTGGFNLQECWSTGYLAGVSAAGKSA
jgi:hypothetical protein